VCVFGFSLAISSRQGKGLGGWWMGDGEGTNPSELQSESVLGIWIGIRVRRVHII
jgi:hypothetical protein